MRARQESKIPVRLFFLWSLPRSERANGFCQPRFGIIAGRESPVQSDLEPGILFFVLSPDAANT